MKMFLPMIIMWLYNKYGLELSLDHIRIAYGVSQAAAVLLQLYILSRVEVSASTTQVVKVKTKSAAGYARAWEAGVVLPHVPRAPLCALLTLWAAPVRHT